MKNGNVKGLRITNINKTKFFRTNQTELNENILLFNTIKLSFLL